MEHFDLKTVSSREKVLILNLNNIDEIIVSDFLSALGKSKINIDSIYQQRALVLWIYWKRKVLSLKIFQ